MQAQPYRKGSGQREPGPAFDAMKRGRTADGHNPMDLRRALAKGKGKGKKHAMHRAVGRGSLAQALARRTGQKPAPPARGGISTARMTSGGQ